jgi:hypothetical protein
VPGFYELVQLRAAYRRLELLAIAVTTEPLLLSLGVSVAGSHGTAFRDNARSAWSSLADFVGGLEADAAARARAYLSARLARLVVLTPLTGDAFGNLWSILAAVGVRASLRSALAPLSAAHRRVSLSGAPLAGYCCFVINYVRTHLT